MCVCVQVELEGEHLNVAKISQSGKKQRKNWNVMWSVLTPGQLRFYKEKQETPLVQKYITLLYCLYIFSGGVLIGDYEGTNTTWEIKP